jgi:hypothetical protein
MIPISRNLVDIVVEASLDLLLFLDKCNLVIPIFIYYEVRVSNMIMLILNEIIL